MAEIAWRDLWFWSKDHWEDGWTYGDWRQYIARRPDGALQPCKVSEFMTVRDALCFFLIASALLAVAICLWNDRIDLLIWENIIGALVIGGIGFVPRVRGYTLMAAVGPRSYDGWRHF